MNQSLLLVFLVLAGIGCAWAEPGAGGLLAPGPGVEVIGPTPHHGRPRGRTYKAWARLVALEEGVPAGLFWQIVRTESNGWPWTLNVDGVPHRFSNRQELERAATRAIQAGADSVDIGIAQVNWQWNGRWFRGGIRAATDPITNLRVAARILKRDWRRSGRSWLGAVEAYHGGTRYERIDYALKVLQQRGL